MYFYKLKIVIIQYEKIRKIKRNVYQKNSDPLLIMIKDTFVIHLLHIFKHEKVWC